MGEGDGVEAGDDAAQSEMRGNAGVEVEKSREEGLIYLSPAVHGDEVLRSGDGGAKEDEEDVDEGMFARAMMSWIGKFFELMKGGGNLVRRKRTAHPLDIA